MSTSSRRALGPRWWLMRRSYFLVFVRELTAIFIAAYLVILLIILAKLGGDAGSYEAFRESLTSPGMLVFGVITLAFTLFHSITFISLIPQGMAIWRGEERVHPALIAGPGYVGLVAVVAIVLVAILR
jgi:fumarate reductase subunit C